jgi:hypothetical protein
MKRRAAKQKKAAPASYRADPIARRPPQIDRRVQGSPGRLPKFKVT